MYLLLVILSRDRCFPLVRVLVDSLQWISCRLHSPCRHQWRVSPCAPRRHIAGRPGADRCSQQCSGCKEAVASQHGRQDRRDTASRGVCGWSPRSLSCRHQWCVSLPHVCHPAHCWASPATTRMTAPVCPDGVVATVSIHYMDDCTCLTWRHGAVIYVSRRGVTTMYPKKHGFGVYRNPGRQRFSKSTVWVWFQWKTPALCKRPCIHYTDDGTCLSCQASGEAAMNLFSVWFQHFSGKKNL